MNRRTCPYCKARSYSSYSGLDWDCPICGKDLGKVPNDQDFWGHLIEALEDDRIQVKLTIGHKNLLPPIRL